MRLLQKLDLKVEWSQLCDLKRKYVKLQIQERHVLKIQHMNEEHEERMKNIETEKFVTENIFFIKKYNYFDLNKLIYVKIVLYYAFPNSTSICPV